MAKKINYKVGDKVSARIGNTISVGTIENIEYDDFKGDMVADLDNGHWVYISQIRRKIC